jgi:hypothetical protein
MSTSNDISTLCNEFTNALTEVLAENAVGPARRGRLARARAAVKKHPEYSEQLPQAQKRLVHYWMVAMGFLSACRH